MSASSTAQITGRELGEAGMSAVLDSHEEWKAAAMGALRAYCKHGGHGWLFRAEQFREWAQHHHVLAEPRKHNAWGALFNHAARLGLIAPTGLFRPAESPKTHGHPVRVWSVA